MDARKLRLVLIGTIFTLIVLTGIGLSLLLGYLSNQATNADHAQIDTELQTSNTVYIKQLQATLDKQKDAVTKVQQVVGSEQDYQYQDQFINEIKSLASTYGIGITGFTFADSTSSSEIAPTTTSPTAVGGGAISSALPAGVKQVLVTVNVQSPIAYDTYLLFLRALELNLTRLEITGVDISPSATDPNSITNSTIGIEMYVRKQ